MVGVRVDTEPGYDNMIDDCGSGLGEGWCWWEGGSKVTRFYDRTSCLEKLHAISEKVIRASRYDFILRGFELPPGFE